MGKPNLNRLEQRAIEAAVAGRLIRAFAGEMGLEKAKQVVQSANEETARQAGQDAAKRLGANSLAELAKDVATWGEGGALDMEVLEQSGEVYRFNVTRCGYADKYREMDLGEFGYCLSCCRDAPFAEGFNPAIELVRSQTIMEGADHCDFHYRYRK